MKFSREDFEHDVFRSLGSASTCWDNLAGAGKFDADKCRNIGDELIKRILDIVNGR